MQYSNYIHAAHANPTVLDSNPAGPLPERQTSCRGVATWTPRPLPHTLKFWVNSINLSRSVQNWTFSLGMQLEDLNVECQSYKWTSSLLNISGYRGQKWHSTKGVVTTHFSNSEKQPMLSPKHSSRTRYNEMSSHIMPFSISKDKNAWITKLICTRNHWHNV